jgi:hypothetical protein
MIDDEEFTIVRSADSQVTPILTPALQDTRLSLAARGLLACALATPGTIDVDDDHLDLLAELAQYGYLSDGVITDDPT